MVVGIPSTAPFSPAFEPKRYWRGPVWAVVNWLIADGLRANGLPDLADDIERGTARHIGRAGFCEYFDPTSGEGLGGEHLLVDGRGVPCPRRTARRLILSRRSPARGAG